MQVRNFLPDKSLRATLLVALALALYGLWWGWVECWNPDQMALRSLMNPGHHLLEPGDFLKPPFHTYLNFFLSVLPLKVAQKTVEHFAGAPQEYFNIAILWWSRLIQAALFLGIVALSYFVTLRASARSSARIVALLIATSAGFAVQAHFLTADIPVTFWLLAAFLAAQSIVINGRLTSYVLAGVLTGIATATKYNALAVGLAIPIFHLFADRRAGWLGLAFDRRLVIGVASVPLAFVLASPFSIISFHSFATDFYYNYVTTPLYQQELGGSGYPLFLARVAEILGDPLAVVTSAGLVTTLILMRNASTISRSTTAACLGVFLLYFWKFGGAPRVEVRFVLPVVPLLVIATGAAWVALEQRSRTLAVAPTSPRI